MPSCSYNDQVDGIAVFPEHPDPRSPCSGMLTSEQWITGSPRATPLMYDGNRFFDTVKTQVSAR
jgi:hypothetical protein